MTTVEVLALNRRDWERIVHDLPGFTVERGLSIGPSAEAFRPVAEQMLALFNRTGATSPPWAGHLAVDPESSVIVGMCGFKAPPDSEGLVEIAYFTFPEFERRGIASAMAAALVQEAERADVKQVIAHTLPEKNASARILEKTGFEKVGEVIDPEDGLVWRWEWRGRPREQHDER